MLLTSFNYFMKFLTQIQPKKYMIRYESRAHIHQTKSLLVKSFKFRLVIHLTTLQKSSRTLFIQCLISIVGNYTVTKHDFQQFSFFMILFNVLKENKTPYKNIRTHKNEI